MDYYPPLPDEPPDRRHTSPEERAARERWIAGMWEKHDQVADELDDDGIATVPLFHQEPTDLLPRQQNAPQAS